MKNWLNLNYKGKENYMSDVNESLEIIKNDIYIFLFFFFFCKSKPSIPGMQYTTVGTMGL